MIFWSLGIWSRMTFALDEVTITRAPLSLAIRSAASATPPPIPQISTVSPAASCARVTTMRQAVSVTKEKAAASAHLSDVGSVGMMARFCSGTTTYGAMVPGRCSPRMP